MGSISNKHALSGLLVLVFVTMAAQAAPFEMIYTGVFSTQNALNPAGDIDPTYFAEPTPFTITAWFDTSSANLAPTFPPAPPPFGGFRAYAPSKIMINIGGTDYEMESISTNPTAGAAVAIFDRNSFEAPHYGVGILQQPPLDGGGIIGDFVGASPDYTAASIVPTVFTGYYGVGYGSGVCEVGSKPDACTKYAVTPFVLHDSLDNIYALTLGNFDEDYPVAHHDGVPVGPLNTAELIATPEPGTFGLAGVALAMLLGAARRRRG
jgi:hypothetical protein